MVDKEIIQRKLAFIDQCLHKLEDLRAMDENDFFSGFQAVDAAKYNLQVSIEAVVDTATHIVARERWGTVNTSAEAIRYLVQHGILEQRQERQLMQMVKFRNQVAHLYQEVNDSEIYRILQENLIDIRDFVQAIGAKYF